MEIKDRGHGMKKCPLCGGILVEKRVTHPQEYEGEIVILENIPAEVCQQCGEVLLRPGVLEQVQQIVWEKKTPHRTAQVPVYDLAELT